MDLGLIKEIFQRLGFGIVQRFKQFSFGNGYPEYPASVR